MWKVKELCKVDASLYNRNGAPSTAISVCQKSIMMSSLESKSHGMVRPRGRGGRPVNAHKGLSGSSGKTPVGLRQEYSDEQDFNQPAELYRDPRQSRNVYYNRRLNGRILRGVGAPAVGGSRSANQQIPQPTQEREPVVRQPDSREKYTETTAAGEGSVRRQVGNENGVDEINFELTRGGSFDPSDLLAEVGIRGVEAGIVGEDMHNTDNNLGLRNIERDRNATGNQDPQISVEGESLESSIVSPVQEHLDEQTVTSGVEIGISMTRREGTSWVLRVPPAGTFLECPVCESQFHNPKGLVGHLKHNHGHLPVKFECWNDGCVRRFGTAHASACHRPKCRNQVAPSSTGDKLCDMCGRTFGSVRGLSTHTRHAHPVQQNELRETANDKWNAAKRDRGAMAAASKGIVKSIWDPDSIGRMLSLAERYKNEANPNQLIALEMPGFTDRQIRSKRSDLNRAGRREKQVAERIVEEPVAPEPTPVLDDNARIIPGDVAHNPPAHVVDQTLFQACFQEYIPARSWERQTLDILMGGGPVDKATVEKLCTKILNLALCNAPKEANGERNNQSNDPNGVPTDNGNTPEPPLTRKQKQTGAYRRKVRRRYGDQRNRTTVQPESRGPRHERRRREKQRRYRRIQSLWEQDISKVAKIVLEGEERVTCEIPTQEIEREFKDRLETVNDRCDLEVWLRSNLSDPDDLPMASNDNICDPVTPDEVGTAIRSMKKESAPGPDGIKIKDLPANANVKGKLSILFNVWLITGEVPRIFLKARSTLLPKSKTDLETLNNWRPLTIGGTAIRLFCKILAARINNAIPISNSQKGFQEVPGCAHNIFILKTLLDQAKAKHHEINVTCLDLRKAFDTIGHKHLVFALRSRNLHANMIQVIESMYNDTNTYFKTATGSTGEIMIKRGIKQGCPLSPTLFNLSLDPLIRVLDKLPGCGFGVAPPNPASCSILGFADDMALVSKEKAQMDRALELCTEFFEKVGLEVNAAKCAGLRIVPKKGKTWRVDSGVDYKVAGETIPRVNPGEFVKYLGIKINPTKWVKANPSKQLDEYCDRISESGMLKPYQKIHLMDKYVIPKFAYTFVVGENCTRKTLKSMDLKIRSVVKNWLHLPACTPTGFIYTAVRDGGLGLPCLEFKIPAERIGLLHGLSAATDNRVHNAAHSGGAARSIDKLTRTYTLRPPTQGRPYKSNNWRKVFRRDWQSLAVGGDGAKQFQRSPRVNRWLREPRFMKGYEYINALKLRANVLPLRAQMARAQTVSVEMRTDQGCRKCNAPRESPGHVLGKCPSNKRTRTRRHDKVVEICASEAIRLQWKVEKEPWVLDEERGTFMRPDLILYRKSPKPQAIIAEITIRFESGTSLARAEAEKRQKYQGIIATVGERFQIPTDEVEVCPVVIGARGAIPPSTIRSLRAFGPVRKGLESLLARRTLLMSLDCLAVHRHQNDT